MKKINNRWVDENDNSWSCDINTKDLALKKSTTLINCSYCDDCSDCSGCYRCDDCSDCSGCYRCDDCSDCSYCFGCYGCSYCSGCHDYTTNPQRYVTQKVGSRKSQTTMYWTSKEDVQIVCGCYKSNLDDFEARVKEVHSNTEHLQPYLRQIEIMKYLVDMNENQ